MQQKEFETVIRQGLPIATGVSSLVIENTGLSTLNFHGIRYSGRIIQDRLGTVNFASGFITLMCIPNDQIAIPSILDEATMNDSNSFIIAILPWSTHHGTDVSIKGSSAIFDFEFAPKTSRSCMQGGKIVGQITNNSPVATITVTHLLSSFETFK